MRAIVMTLNTLAVLFALYITLKAYQDSFKWGVFFFLTPLSIFVLARYVTPLVAALIVVGLQLYYVLTHWRSVGVAYTVMVVLWFGALMLPRMVAAPT